MQYSAEVRWFYAGAIPDPTKEWFLDNRSIPCTERTDRYLLLPGCDSVGIKIREGAFEVKARKGIAEPARYASAVTGRTDCWVKWSCNQPAVRPWVQALLAESSGWIDVAKTRWQRAYKLADGRPGEIPVESVSAEACTVELTQIEVRGSAWWSVALEAVGRPAHTRSLLQIVGEFFFAAHPPVDPFYTIHSCSYPDWLQGLTAS